MNNQILVYEWMLPGGNKNFGDLLSKPIIEGVLKRKVIQVTDGSANILGIGSVLDPINTEFNNVKYIWGSGFIREGNKLERQDVQVLAARGELTRARLGKDVPLGDPGLLASKYFKRSDEMLDKIGIVSHFLDTDNPKFKKWKMDDRFEFIDVCRDPQEVILDITKYKAIISTSLHGLIISDSFNIPNFWGTLSPEVGTYKFYDYYSGVGKEYELQDAQGIFDKTYEEILVLIKGWTGVNGLDKIQNNLEQSLKEGVDNLETPDDLLHTTIPEFEIPKDFTIDRVMIHTHRRFIRDVSNSSHVLRTMRKLGFTEIYTNQHVSEWSKLPIGINKIKLRTNSYVRDYKWLVKRQLKKRRVNQ